MIPLSLPPYLQFIATSVSVAFIFLFLIHLFTMRESRQRFYERSRSLLFNIYVTDYFGTAKKASTVTCGFMDKYLLPPQSENRLLSGGYFSSSRFARAVLLATLYLLIASAIFDLGFDTANEQSHGVRTVFEWHEDANEIPPSYFSLLHLLISNLIALGIPFLLWWVSKRINHRIVDIAFGIGILFYAANSGNLCPYLAISQSPCYEPYEHNFLISLFNFSVHGVYLRPAFAGTVMVLLAFLTIARSLHPVLALLIVIGVVYLQQFGLLTIRLDSIRMGFSDYWIFGAPSKPSYYSESIIKAKSTRNAALLGFIIINAAIDLVSSSISRYLFWVMRKASIARQYFSLIIADLGSATVLFAAIPLGIVTLALIADYLLPNAFGGSLAPRVYQELKSILDFDGNVRPSWIVLMIVTSLIPSLVHLFLLLIEVGIKVIEPIIRKVAFAGDYLISDDHTVILGIRISAVEKLLLLMGVGLSLPIIVFQLLA